MCLFSSDREACRNPDDFSSFAPEPFPMEKLGTTDAPFLAIFLRKMNFSSLRKLQNLG